MTYGDTLQDDTPRSDEHVVLYDDGGALGGMSVHAFFR